MLPPLAILFGGDGSERRVSVASAQNVASILDEASLWFWRPDGSVLEVERHDLLGFERPFERDFAPDGGSPWPSLPEALDSNAARGRAFFLALHGGAGEDGTVQSLLESRELAFTGSGTDKKPSRTPSISLNSTAAEASSRSRLAKAAADASGSLIPAACSAVRLTQVILLRSAERCTSTRSTLSLMATRISGLSA